MRHARRGIFDTLLMLYIGVQHISALARASPRRISVSLLSHAQPTAAHKDNAVVASPHVLV